KLRERSACFGAHAGERGLHLGERVRALNRGVARDFRLGERRQRDAERKAHAGAADFLPCSANLGGAGTYALEALELARLLVEPLVRFIGFEAELFLMLAELRNIDAGGAELIAEPLQFLALGLIAGAELGLGRVELGELPSHGGRRLFLRRNFGAHCLRLEARSLQLAAELVIFALGLAERSGAALGALEGGYLFAGCGKVSLQAFRAAAHSLQRAGEPVDRRKEHLHAKRVDGHASSFPCCARRPGRASRAIRRGSLN